MKYALINEDGIDRNFTEKSFINQVKSHRGPGRFSFKKFLDFALLFADPVRLGNQTYQAR